MIKLVLAAALTAASLSAPALAQDDPAEETFTALVRHDDLNLASTAGRATFRGRVKALANRLCGTPPVLPFTEAEAVAACRTQLMRSAELQVSLALAPVAAEVTGTR